MPTNLRFKFDYKKCVEAIQFLALNRPGITQYYVGKVMFFADKEHILDWGRPICGDRYVAMEHGPVPSMAYDIIKSDAGEPDEVEDYFRAKIRTEPEGNKRHLYSAEDNPCFRCLSESDKEYLEESLSRYGSLSFTAIKRLSHEDPAYAEAWSQPGLNNEMDIARWLTSEQMESLLQSPFVQKKVAA